MLALLMIPHRYSIVSMDYLWRIDVLFMENQRWIRNKKIEFHLSVWDDETLLFIS